MRLTLDDTVICDLARDVAPRVEQTTGWDLREPELKYRVIPRERAYEELVLERFQGAGIAMDPDDHRDFLERLVEHIFEGSIGGAYDPCRQTILIVRENLDDSNMDGLRVVLAHELTHRAQHCRHPEAWTFVDDRLRLFWSRLDGAEDLAALSALCREFQAQVQPVMTVLESHAAFVQECLHRDLWPEARIESHFNIWTLLFRVLGHAKVAQYTDGLPRVAAAVGGPAMDALFRDSLAAG